MFDMSLHMDDALRSENVTAGGLEFRAHDDDGRLVFEIESWARSSDRVFDFLYDRLGIARELQLDM